MQNPLANLNPPASPMNALAAFEGGQAFGERIRLKKALAAYSVNPDDPEALKVITELDTALGAKLREEQRDRQFNRAAEGYFAGQPNALSARSAQAPQGMPNALVPPAQPGQSFEQAFAPYAQQQPAPAAAPAQEELDFSALGQPASQQDAAFLQMLRVDAKRAFEIDSEMRDRAADRLKQQRDGYAFAVQRLGGVKDDKSYQAALADIQARIEPLGVQVTNFLPARYPGPDGLREIRLGAIDADDQMRIFMQEANIDADNARSDRNTDSLIGTREERLSEYRRHNRENEGNTRRGQDIRTTRSNASRGGSSRPTATDRKGNKVEWDGKAWVPVK